MASIEIPLKTTEEVLVVNLNDLKDDETFLLDLLAEERITSGIYIEISIEYWKQGLLEQFERFLKSGRSTASKLQDASSNKARAMLLSMLGLYYLEVIRLLKSGVEFFKGYSVRDLPQLEQEVRKIHNEAVSLEANDVTTLLLQANLLRNSSSLSEALITYSKLSALEPSCVPALLGEADIHYTNCDYAKALEKYQAALSFDPKIDLDRRIKMGVCFYYLGMNRQALRSFQRILEIDPDNRDANLLVAAVEIQAYRNSKIPAEDKEKTIIDINERIFRAVESFPNSLLLKYLLARIMLTREDFERALELSNCVIQAAPSNKRVLQQMIFCKSRCLQYKGKYEDAFNNFESFTSFETSTPAFESLLSQMYLEKGNASKSLSLLESVLKKTNNSYFPALRYMSVGLSREVLSKSQALELLSVIKKPTEKIDLPNSARKVFEPYVLAKIASHHDILDIQTSLELYTNAIAKMNADDIEVSYVFYNNVGALSYKLVEPAIGNVSYYEHELPSGKTILREEYFDKMYSCTDKEDLEDLCELEHLFAHSKYLLTYLVQAEKCYMYALSLAKEKLPEDSDDLKISEATIMINSAILKRSVGMLQSSHNICEKLLHKYPTYVENRLLLSQIYLSWREFDNCYHHLRTATSIDVNSITSRLLLATYHLERNNNYQEAKRVYDSILRDINSNDAYALCELGNLNIKFVRGSRTKEQRNTYLDRALRLYNSALKKNNRNIYAALGIGTVLIEKGQLSTARTVFSQIEQPVVDNNSIAVNLAQIHLALDHHGARMSIPLCRKALIKKNGSYDIFALELLSRSYYITAKETKSVYYMRLALKYIQIALLFFPKYSNFFNIALIKQQMSQILSEQPLETRSLLELENELGKLDVSEQLFTALSKKTNVLKPKHIELSKSRAEFCKDVRSQALRKIRETAILDAQRRERLEEIKKHQQRVETEKSVKQMDEMNRLTEEEYEIQKYRNELQQKVIQDMEKLAQTEAVSQKVEDKKYEMSKTPEKSVHSHSRHKLSSTSTYVSRDHMELRPVQGINSEEARERRPRKRRNLHLKAYVQTSSKETGNKKQRIDGDVELQSENTYVTQPSSS